MNIVVTGYLGFIGSHLMPSLPEAIGLDVKDGNNILDCQLPPADVVIHLAAKPGVIQSLVDPYASAETNILGTIRLLRHYSKAKFIFASSGGTIQETIESPYGLSKYAGEEYIKLLHDNYVILRFPNVYGPNSRSVVDKWLQEEELTVYGNGLTYRIYAHVSDVVEAILLALDWPVGEYKLGGERQLVLDIARAMAKPLVFAPARPGEITHLHSQLPNVTPNWQPKIHLMDYINEHGK